MNRFSLSRSLNLDTLVGLEAGSLGSFAISSRFRRLRLRCLPFPSRFSGSRSRSDLLELSIRPKTVIPLVAKFSSGTAIKRRIPRLGDTLRDSDRKDCIRVAFRLFVVGCI